MSIAIDDLYIAVHNLSIAIDDLYIAVDNLSIAIDDLYLAVHNLSIAADNLSIAVDDLYIAADDLCIAVDNLCIAADDLCIAVDNLYIALYNLYIVVDDSRTAVEKLSEAGNRISAVDVAREALSLCRENVRLGENGLKAGTVTSAKHAETVAALKKAEMDELQASLGYRLAKAELDRITGVLASRR